MPIPYPHRAAFLAAKFIVPPHQVSLRTLLSRLISVTVFDHFLRHPIISLGDEDDRSVDTEGRTLDASHPHIEQSMDQMFRVARRREILWFEISVEAEQPPVTVLRAQLPNGVIDVWDSASDVPLSAQLSQCIAKWLTARRLPMGAALAEFTFADLRAAAERLAKASIVLPLHHDYTQVLPQLLTPLPRLAVPYLRVLAELSSDAAPAIESKLLEIDPSHPVMRRNEYVRGLTQGSVAHREILPLVAEAPMYAKPHLLIWGEPFHSDRTFEGIGVRHQGIAASLLPANPFACHNYSLQLAEVGRREESYRWADRATVADPDFGAAHLDCVRRLRHVGRRAQAFAEAQYRCGEILEYATTATLPTSDWQAPHHAALLIAFVHFDIGRLAEAIEIADHALSKLANDDATREAFAWAFKRVADWRNDAGLFARAYAFEGYYRGEPGRALAGLGKTRISDDEDAMILIDSLLAVGRDDEAEIAAFHALGLDGHGVLGDGKGRLAAARALILAGRLDDALEHIQVVQLRRSQSRHEAEINRLLRLAAIHPAAEWERVIARLLQLGAHSLGQRAARDLADFVPGMASPLIFRALGERPEIAVDPRWISDLIGAVPAVQATAPSILHRLARPTDDSLAAADKLAEEWWTALVPPSTDRDVHAAGALLAFGIAFANYLTETARSPTPIAGGYRHIATEALHLVRQSRHHIAPDGLRALLVLVERLSAAPDWLLDPWLLCIERAFDAEADYGGYLDDVLAGLPNVTRLLRGDERIGWETRVAHDFAAESAAEGPAARLFERSVRAVETGALALAWSTATARTTSAAEQLDVHWIAAVANPVGAAAPWLSLAVGLLSSGHPNEGFTAACRGMAAATAQQRAQAFQDLAEPWRLASILTPLDGDRAFEAGLAAAADDRFHLAVQHLRWAVAVEPSNAKRTQHLAIALTRSGRPLEAIRAVAAHERSDGPRIVGRLLIEAGRESDAVPILRYACRWSESADDFTLLAIAAHRATDYAVAAAAGKRAVSLGSSKPELLAALATSLYRLGEFADCEEIAQRLNGLVSAPSDARAVGRLAMARALVGQRRYDEALPYAQELGALDVSAAVADELIETMGCIVAQRIPPVAASSQATIQRQAFMKLEAGHVSELMPHIASTLWPIARAALTACEFRTETENAVPVSSRALEAAAVVLGRSRGTTAADAALARIQALRIRDNAYIQIDPPPLLGKRYSAEEFERAYRERDRRPRRASALLRNRL